MISGTAQGLFLHASQSFACKSELKPDWVTRVKQVTFCAGHLGWTWIIKICGSDPDLALTALLEYFNLLAHAVKMQSCYLFSYRLAS